MNPQWTTAVSVVGVGLVLGVVSAFVLGRSVTVEAPAGRGGKTRGRKVVGRASRPSPTATEDLTDLVARRDAALTRLRELAESESGPTGAERIRLEIEAAQAMRALEAGRANRRETRSSGLEQSVLAHRWLWGVASAAIAVAIVWGLRTFSVSRADGAPMTGGPGAMDSSTAHEEAPDDPVVGALRKKVEKDPQNIELRLDLADAELRSTSGYFDAFQNAKMVLARDPTNGRALIQQAVVRSAMGQHQMALQLAETAAESHPTLVQAWIARGRESAVLRKKAEAIASYEKAIALSPTQADMIKPWLEDARSEADVPVTSPASVTSATNGSLAQSIQGTVDLDPTLAASVADGAYVFVTVKDGSESPMPIAAKRIPARGFPISFTIGQADAIMGRSFPASIHLEARLDSDGNASTRDPSDPVAHADHVAPGTTGLRLVLQSPNESPVSRR